MKELLLFAAFAPSTPCDFSAFDKPVTPTITPVKYEYRLIGGRVIEAPIGSPWNTSPYSLQPAGCPNGRCPTPR